MKINKEQVSVERTLYVADDGVEFENQSQCDCYETMLQCQKEYEKLKKTVVVSSDGIEHEFVYCNNATEYNYALDYLRYGHATPNEYDDDGEWVVTDEFVPVSRNNIFGISEFKESDWYCFEFFVETDGVYLEYISVDSYNSHKNSWEAFNEFFKKKEN